MRCLVVGCNSNNSSAKSFFSIPDPRKKFAQCNQWLLNVNHPDTASTYVYKKGNVICEDHFDASCFERTLMDKLLGPNSTSRKRLKPGAVPTHFSMHSGSQKRPFREIIDRENLPQGQKPQDNLEHQDGPIQVKKLKHRSLAPDVIYKRPEMKDQAVQVSPAMMSIETSCNIQTEDVRYIQVTADTSLTDHGYCTKQIPDSTLNTAFIDHSSTIDNSSVVISSPDSSPTSSPDTTVDNSDPSYVPSDESCDQDQEDDVPVSEHMTDPKFLVFESSIRSLFARLNCTECCQPISPESTEISYNGTSLKAVFTCMLGHTSEWTSQPSVQGRPAGNLMTAAAILLTGQTFSHFASFADTLNMKFIGKTQFYSIQKELTIPSIDRFYGLQKEAVMETLENKQLVLSGDGRCDSPGFSAKYCTYTFMDTKTAIIPDFSLVQVTETTSSVAMELEGFKRALGAIEDSGLEVDVIVTDRHVQIRKEMKTEHADIQHQFDVWHLAKALRKKLTKAASNKASELKEWIPSISNHLWWCSRNANGNADLLVESFNSILYHVINQHTFPGKLLTACGHKDLTGEETRRKKWLSPDSKAYKALCAIVMDKRLQKDIRQLSLFCHTGHLETYHSMLTKYCPKRQEFDYASMVARCQLAVIDHNVNTDRKQKKKEDGTLSYAVCRPKSTGRWTCRPIYEEKDYTFRDQILQFVLLNAEGNVKLPAEHQTKALSMPRNITKTVPPLKEDMIDSHQSRFT